jgi:hypothetical protein
MTARKNSLFINYYQSRRSTIFRILLLEVVEQWKNVCSTTSKLRSQALSISLISFGRLLLGYDWKMLTNLMLCRCSSQALFLLIFKGAVQLLVVVGGKNN